MDNQAAEHAMTPLVDLLDAQIRAVIDKVSASTGQPRELLCIDVGKELILLGCNYVGNGIGIGDPEVGLQPGRDCIKAFQELFARSKGAAPRPIGPPDVPGADRPQFA